MRILRDVVNGESLKNLSEELLAAGKEMRQYILDSFTDDNKNIVTVDKPEKRTVGSKNLRGKTAIGMILRTNTTTPMNLGWETSNPARRHSLSRRVPPLRMEY